MIAVLVIILNNIPSGFPTLFRAVVVWQLHTRLESPNYDQYVIRQQSIMDSQQLRPRSSPTALRIGIALLVSRIAAIGVKTGLI